MSLFACSSCSYLFSITSRFKGVLGMERTTNVGLVVPVAKEQHPVVVVVGQPTSILPQIEVTPPLIERSGSAPAISFGISAGPLFKGVGMMRISSTITR